MTGIPILMYHALEDASHPAGARDQGEQLYVLPADTFRKQMAYLQREKYQTFLLHELHELEALPEKPVVLTFDDGHASNYSLALPILLEYGFKAEFFITTSWIGTEHYMTSRQIAELGRAGMGVGSHGVTHRYRNDMSQTEIEEEFKSSRAVLERLVGQCVNAFSFPGGRMGSGTLEIGQNTGYRFLLSSEFGSLRELGGDGPIPRYAINNRITRDAFASLLKGRRELSQALRYYLLATLKLLLGNRLYDYTRSVLTRKHWSFR